MDNKLLENYIPWEFDREFTEKQKIRRLKDLEKYILHLYEKMHCTIYVRSMFDKIVEKYFKLVVEYNDLVWNLNMEDGVELFSDKLMGVKANSGFCLICENGVVDIDLCTCEDCNTCGRIQELCFCKK